MSGAVGAGMSTQPLTHRIEQSTGLRVPDDVETMLGDSTSFAVGGDLDYEALSNAGDGSQIPVGAVVTGDPGRLDRCSTSPEPRCSA